MRNAVCYVRVSSMAQREGVSLDVQVARVTGYCLAEGLNVCRVVCEVAVSATKPLPSRPGGSELLRLIENRGATDVVVFSLDRLFRRMNEAISVLQDWEAAGITLHVVDMGGQSLNTSLPMGRLFIGMLSTFAEFEQRMIADRTTAALAYKKHNRQVYNSAPYGFQKKDGMLVPDEREQRVLDRMFDLRKQGGTLYAIATELNRRKIPSKKGGRWHSETVRHILQNDLYDQFHACHSGLEQERRSG